MLLFAILTCYLNIQQWNSIRLIKTTPHSDAIDAKINQVIFSNYQGFLFNTLKKFNKHRNADYIYGANLVLYKAITKYNYSLPTPFNKYAEKCILHYIYACHRRSKQSLLFDTKQIRREGVIREPIAELLQLIDEALTPAERRLLYCKYDRFTMQKIRTDREVCELNAFSLETLRKRMNRIKAKLAHDSVLFSSRLYRFQHTSVE